ncbi:MAG TPA: O-antigen ligase family protein [Cyclobacteriaceae bacterium]|nr:O-antigen ligase family protein [Cyclobacteriaceae bacterium]
MIQTFHPSTAVRFARIVRGEGSMPGWVQWLLGIAAAAVIAKLTAGYGIIIAIAVIALVVVVPIGTSMLWRAEVGVYIVLLLAFFISIPNRLYEGIPMGISLDVVIVGSLAGLLFRCAREHDWSIFKTPVTMAILLWAGMNVLEVANPFAASRAAWFFVIRPAVEYMMLFFVTYSALHTPAKLTRFLFVLLFLSAFSGLWGIRQATVGYFSWEFNYVFSHDLVHLVFNYGRWRAIGSIGSPSQYGMLMAFISMLSLALLSAYRGIGKKIFLACVAVITLLAMVYSGTRTAYIIVPVFYLTWVILSRNRKLYYSIGLAGGLMAVVATMPTNNYHIQRIQSVFSGSKDASYQVRARNRSMIFPWILAHPIGGGLGSTGTWGQRFSPGTFLANFPPDSGLVRVAVELGWIGLGFFLYVYYKVLVDGTRLFWAMKNPVYKAMTGGMIAGITPLLIAEWGQEVVGVFPLSLLFWMFLAVLFRAVHFDRQEQLAANQQIPAQ